MEEEAFTKLLLYQGITKIKSGQTRTEVCLFITSLPTWAVGAHTDFYSRDIASSVHSNKAADM
jgi:hypothetical protein